MKPVSTVPFTVARYAVVIAGAEPVQRRTEQEALAVARRQTHGARVYLCVGELATDLWRRPVLVAEFGPKGRRLVAQFVNVATGQAA